MGERGETYANVKCQKRVSVAFSRDFHCSQKKIEAHTYSYTQKLLILWMKMYGGAGTTLLVLLHVFALAFLPSSDTT